MKAREFVLLPNMQAAWPVVKEVALEGAANNRVVEIVELFGFVLMDGNLELLETAPIAVIIASARLGINSLLVKGEIGPIGAKSLDETVDLFLEAYTTLTEVR